MPLIAIDTAAGGRAIDLTSVDDMTWAAIWRQRTRDRLRCRACDVPLIAKQRESSGLRFFAHHRVVPECPSHGETPRHLHLKSVFATAFRSAGWTAELEAAGEGWRADVLAESAQGRRVAIEVQLAAITPDVVRERMARHSAAGVSTLWVLERRPEWAGDFPTVLVGNDDRIVDTVVISDRPGRRPTMAPSVSVGRFVERWSQDRLQGIGSQQALVAAVRPSA